MFSVLTANEWICSKGFLTILPFLMSTNLLMRGAGFSCCNSIIRETFPAKQRDFSRFVRDFSRFIFPDWIGLLKKKCSTPLYIQEIGRKGVQIKEHLFEYIMDVVNL